MEKIDKLNIDGRRAEIHVNEQESDGVLQRVTTHFEEKIPLEMRKRVSEKVVPVVMERVTEDFVGEVSTGKTVEKIADEMPIKLTDLKQVQCLSKEDIAEIVKSVLEQTKGHSFSLPSLPKMPKLFTAPTDSPPVVVVNEGTQAMIHYALVVFLAIEFALLVWQWFIR